MSIERISGIVLFVGCALFIIAAFSPISWVFAEHVVEKKIEMVNQSPDAWKLAQVFFGSGAFVTVAGLLLAYFNLRRKNAGFLSFAALMSAFIGVIPWLIHVYLRAMDPDAAFRGELHPRWFLAIYFTLTLIAIVLFGMALLKAGYPRWVGWFNVAACIALVAMFIFSGALPPFFYYAVISIGAIVLFVGDRSSWRKSTHEYT